MLRSTLKNCDEVIISNAVKKYYENRQWRWEPRPINEAVESSQNYVKSAFGSPPPKKCRLQDMEVSAHHNESDSDSSSDEDESDMDF